MSTKRSRPLVRKLPDPLVTVDRSPMADVALSPTSPLERNLRSPKGWKNRESDGVGLGIVAALQKIGGGDASAKVIVGTPNIGASAPISIAASRSSIGKSELGFTRPSRVDEEFPAFRTADFLSHCCLCSKRLHGKDIYMYRGEKAFCSTECRFRQIVSDEFQEKCGPKASKPSDISSSPYSSGGRLFFTAIAAA